MTGENYLSDLNQLDDQKFKEVLDFYHKELGIYKKPTNDILSLESPIVYRILKLQGLLLTESDVKASFQDMVQFLDSFNISTKETLNQRLNKILNSKNDDQIIEMYVNQKVKTI